ncbi:MAG: hypothetical protein A2284_06735 [Deltaproteobacteria bacterium RIFOXYA12_FULL_61_11]|nr:MAG: hypothetical protein A2284_06735 [Deltaproteobacteria bacterium RIFOXYA12_FULL_61_11]
MSCCSRPSLAAALAVVCLLFTTASTQAMNVQAVYTASCQRQVGVLLEVGRHHLTMLTLSGRILSLPRHELIYMVEYPLDSVPFEGVRGGDPSRVVDIVTRQGTNLLPLVKGWPIDYSRDDISFLSLDGAEVVVHREHIFGLEFSAAPTELLFPATKRRILEFVHPYVFASCAQEPPPLGSSEVSSDPSQPEAATIVELERRKIFPQQFFPDPVAIKRELDRRLEGYERLRIYERSQKFYPVPQVYKNLTSLGLWLSAGSRYGASGSRSNNLNPMLVNEYSSGPFGYQHRLVSGNGPMPYSLHTEIQSQLYYRFKADYFHLSAMLDPNLFLVGDKYAWTKEDLDPIDERFNEMLLVESGLDFGPLSLEWYLIDPLNTAVRQEEDFLGLEMNLMRFGLVYHHYLVRVSLVAGRTFGFLNSPQHSYVESEGSSPAELVTTPSLDVVRLNVDLTGSDSYLLNLSTIVRRFGCRSDQITWTEEGSHLEEGLRYRSLAVEPALHGSWRFGTRYELGGFLSTELRRIEHGTGSLEDTRHRLVPKLGVLASLTF